MSKDNIERLLSENPTKHPLFKDSDNNPMEIGQFYHDNYNNTILYIEKDFKIYTTDNQTIFGKFEGVDIKYLFHFNDDNEHFEKIENPKSYMENLIDEQKNFIKERLER